MENIYETLKKYEFDKTEAETLYELVKKAVDKGNQAQNEIKTLAKAARIAAEKLVEKKLVYTRPIPDNIEKIPPVVGIDGSCQKVGGFGGKWYVPISCAIVKILEGDIANVDVEVTANIEEIQQQEFHNIGADIAKVMMLVESKAISVWAQKAPLDSYIILDGPIIDPPAERDQNYVNLRSAAIKSCDSKKICLIGCVKRTFDTTFRNFALESMSEDEDSFRNVFFQFPSDSHLLTFALTYLAGSQDSSNYVQTKILPLEDNEINDLYIEQGVKVFFTYVQKTIGTSLLRVEVAIPPHIAENQIDEYVTKATDLCIKTTYPGHYVPLLVQLAHDKCNIRQGCAEVLYDDIMTRSRTAEPIEQIVLSKLR